MSMQSINFNSGNYKEYAINGDENRVKDKRVRRWYHHKDTGRYEQC